MNFGWMFGLGMGFMFAFFLVGILLFAFWIWMLIDCITRKFKSDVDKIVWVLVLLFLNLLGAVIYYFIVKSKK